MRGKALSFLVSFAFALGLALSLARPVAAAEVWRGPSSLEVRVEDSAGKAVEGAKVRLLYQAVEPKTGPAIASTDEQGEAYFFSLAEGWWALEVKKDGALTIHAEFVLSGEKKPAVLSTFQENTPGGTQTLRVAIGRPRAGRAAGDPTGGPKVGKPAPVAPPASPEAKPSAPTPALPPTAAPPAPAAAPAPVEKPAALPTAPPTPAPSATAVVPPEPAPPASAVTAPPPAASSPAPTPLPTTAPPSAAAPDQTPPPSSPSAPAPVVSPSAPAPQSVPPLPGTPAPSAPPAVAPPPSPTPAAAPTPTPPAAIPAPAAASPVPTPAAPAPALPEPRVQRRSYSSRNCLECKPGEEALSVEVEVAAGSAPCGDGLEARLRERDAAKAEGGLSPSCRLLRVVLPPEARFTGYRYEVEEGGASRDCRAGADCPVGACRFPLDPGIRRGPTGTAFTAAFENSSPNKSRRAIFTVYYAPEG